MLFSCWKKQRCKICIQLEVCFSISSPFSCAFPTSFWSVLIYHIYVRYFSCSNFIIEFTFYGLSVSLFQIIHKNHWSHPSFITPRVAHTKSLIFKIFFQTEFYAFLKPVNPSSPINFPNSSDLIVALVHLL